VPIFRPGTSTPGSHAPYQSAPLPGGRSSRVPATRLRRSLVASTAEGIFAEVVTACAGGAVLTGWALYLGAGPLAIGILGALPFLAQFVHLPAALLTEWLGRRRVALWSVAASRQVYLPLIALPFLPLSQGAKLALLLTVAALSGVLAVIGNNAWVAWMGDRVPSSLRGRYFGVRTALCTLGGAVAALAAGLLLDGFRAREMTAWALSALSVIAVLAGALTTYLMSLQHEPAPQRPAQRVHLRAALAPFTDPRASRVLAYQLTWNAAIGVSASFFAVHMIENLKMGFALMAVQAASVSAVRIFAVPLWGRAIDRVGAKPVLVACSFGIVIIPLIWLLPTPDRLWPLAIDSVVSGLLWSGHALAAFALPLAVAPREGRSFYLGAFSAAGGLAFAVASAGGGLLATSMPANLLVFGQPMYGLQVLFVVSSVGRLGSAALALRIVEPGARPLDELFTSAARRLTQTARRVARLPLARRVGSGSAPGAGRA